jgi:hypothetical protein
VNSTCHRCGEAIAAVERVGRRDICPQCGSDLRCCRNCRFHDPQAPNQCREPQAERQADVERGNFCEWFALADRREPRHPTEARTALEGLFAARKRS